MTSSPTTRGPRQLFITAVAALSVWLASIIGLTLWTYPYFWREPREHDARARSLAARGRSAEAVRELDLAVRKAPDDPGLKVHRGYLLLDRGEAPAAEREFRLALRVQPSNAEAGLGLARALVDQHRRDEAIAELEKLPADALTDEHLRRRSQLFGLLKMPGAALVDLSRLVRTGATDPEVLKEGATHAETLRDWPRVITWTDWLMSAPLEPEVRRWAAEVRARAEMALGRKAAAYESYRIAANPDHLEHRAGLAWDLRKFEDAAALFEELARQYPGEPRFRRMRAFALLAAGRRDAAEAAFRHLVHEGAADVAVRRAYAWTLNVQRRYAEAWQVIEPLPRPAQDPALLELQARTAVWAGRTADAMQLVPALLRTRPDDAGLWKDLAEIAHAAGDTRRAADALAAYLRLQSQDARSRHRLAEMLAAAGSLEAAVAQYERLLADDPRNVQAARALGLLQESGGDLAAATASYLRALEGSTIPAPELYLRLARLHRWMAQPLAAVEWYERYLASLPEIGRRREAQGELALSLLEAGQAPRSLALLQSMSDDAALDADALLTAARAAAALARPDLAARYLEYLGAVRPLTPDERAWLGGAYRAAGQPHAALRTYEALAADPDADVVVLEAVADLRYDRGDYAGALRMLKRVGTRAEVRLKLARIAARVGDLRLAAEAYETFTGSHPANLEARLEAARFFAALGEAPRAARHYRAVVDRRGADGLRIELARIHLAAEDFRTAEGWARQAAVAGEDWTEAQLALAQALHVQGQHREADATLRRLVEVEPGHADAHAWRGRIAVARDRHFTAYREFERALASGAEGGERIALWMSTAARKRGDYRTALDSLERATTLGAELSQVAAARRELRTASAARLSTPAELQGDTTGLRLAHVGGGIRFLLPRLLGALSFTGASGTLEQHAFSTVHTGVVVSLEQVFPTPALELGARLGLHQFERADSLISWHGTATLHLMDQGLASLSFTRRPVLPLVTLGELRQFNRVVDLGTVGPGFFSDGLQALTEFFTTPTHRTRMELGGERFSDGNRRTGAYVHYQVPVATGVRQWTVLRPNVFLETFRRKESAYFSPKRHLTLGTMVHTVRHYPHGGLEVELNPQLLRTDGASGFGGHGLVNLQIRRGRATLDAGTFVFYDGLENYLQWRVSGRLAIRIGR